jgi:hypothetical protein
MAPRRQSAAARKRASLEEHSEGASSIDDGEQDRVLLYPKAYITITLDIPRAKSMYVIVKTKVLDVVTELGRTDSHVSEGDEVLTFEKTIAITYFIGIDDNQLAIFEIMDGDILNTSAFGYIFAAVPVTVGEIFRG